MREVFSKKGLVNIVLLVGDHLLVVSDKLVQQSLKVLDQQRHFVPHQHCELLEMGLFFEKTLQQFDTVLAVLDHQNLRGVEHHSEFIRRD